MGCNGHVYLLSKPGLLLAAVFVADVFVLGADFFQGFVEVLLGFGVHLHVDGACNLRAQCCQLLKDREQQKSQHHA